MLAQRERVSVRRHVTDKRSPHGRIGCECQNRFNFSVLRKRLGRIDGDGRTRGIEFVRALLAQGLGYAMHIAQKEIGGIHQDSAGLGAGIFGCERKAAENRFRKRLAYRQLFGRIFSGAAKILIGPDQ